MKLLPKFLGPYLCAAFLISCSTFEHDAEMKAAEPGFLPNAEASKVVAVAEAAPYSAEITVLTEAIAEKEHGPKETVAQFGEVYAFAPSYFAVHRDEPTRIVFWNLQGDDEHDFMLADPQGNVLMKAILPPLKKTGFVFTFHEEGLFSLYCTMHRSEMNAQILVLPPMSTSH